MTDFDARERNAIKELWPDARLLLCTFHVRSCWRSHRVKHIKGEAANKYRKPLQDLEQRYTQCSLRTHITSQRTNIFLLLFSRLISSSSKDAKQVLAGAIEVRISE